MEANILKSTKKKLGLADDYDVFDEDVLTFINGVFSTIFELGIGPEDGLTVDETSEWDELYGTDPRFNDIRTYVYLRVRVLFDPPSTSFLQAAMREQIKELEWRLNVKREELQWQSPVPATGPDEIIIDGGAP